MKADVERCHYPAHAAVNSINISKRRALEMGRCEGCFSCSPSMGGGTMGWMRRYLGGKMKLERCLQASEQQPWPSLFQQSNLCGPAASHWSCQLKTQGIPFTLRLKDKDYPKYIQQHAKGAGGR